MSKFLNSIGMQIRREVLKVDSQPSKKSKTSGGQGSGLLKKSKHLGCVFQDTEPPKSKSILRKTRNLCSTLKRYVTPRKMRERKVPRKEIFTSANLKSAVLVLPNSRKEHRKKPCNKNGAPAEKHDIWRKHVHKLKDKDKATFNSPSEEA